MANETPGADDAPSFARGNAGPFGKYLIEVKTYLDEPTYNLWLQLCATKDPIPPSEIHRDYLYLLLRGKTPAEILAEQKPVSLSIEGRNEALNRIGGGA